MRRRGRRAEPRDRAHHSSGGRDARLGLRSVRLARPAGRRRPDAVQGRWEVPHQCARRAQTKDRALRDQGAARLAAGPVGDGHAAAAQVPKEARGEIHQNCGPRRPQGRGAAAPGRPGRGGRGRGAEPARRARGGLRRAEPRRGPRRPAVRRRVRPRPEVRPGLRARSAVFGADARAVRGRRGVPARRGGPRVARGGRPRAAGAEQLRADHDPRGAAGRRRLRDARDATADVLPGPAGGGAAAAALPTKRPEPGRRRARPATALRRRPADLRRGRADLRAAREGVRGGGARVRARRGAAARAPGPEPAARAPGPGRGGHAPAPRGAAAARTTDAGAHPRRRAAARAPRALRRGPRPRRGRRAVANLILVVCLSSRPRP